MRPCVAVSLVCMLMCMSIAACGGDTSPTSPTSPESLTFTLSGTITDRSTGQPLPGATVNIMDGSNQFTANSADTSGHYSLGRLTPGGFTVRATQPYYQEDSRGVTLTSNMTQDFALDFIPPYTRNGIGNAVFDYLPPERQIRIRGEYTKSSSPFVVSIDNELLVNELLGTSHPKTTFEGTFRLAAGTVVIEKSTGVAWSFTEIR